MKHISFVIGGMTRGGAERVISILSNYYASQGWKVDIVMLLNNEVNYELNPNIRLIDMTMNNESRIKSAPKWVIEFRKYVKENNPDIIVSFVARINIVVLLATFGLNTPVIISERNDPAADGRSKIIDIATKLLYRKAKAIVYQTERAQNYFRGKIRSLGVIIPNPISITCVAEKTKNKIVSVGRLAPQKNQKLLIDSFNEVVKTHPEYSLYIYGDGSLKEELETQIKYLRLENKVFLPGNKPDVHKEISDAKIFVLSSDYEGLSNAMLEAMMMGFPCICTNCAGADEYIINGENGMLVPIKDKNSMVKAINYLIENSDATINMGEKAKESVGKCSVESIMKEWNKLIES